MTTIPSPITTDEWKDMAKCSAQKANEDQRAMTPHPNPREEIVEILSEHGYIGTIGHVPVINDNDSEVIDRLLALLSSAVATERKEFAKLLIKDYAEGNFVGLGSIAKAAGLTPTD